MSSVFEPAQNIVDCAVTRFKGGDPIFNALVVNRGDAFGIAVADDFGIGHTTKPSYLRGAIKSLIPDVNEFTSASLLREDINDAIASIECHLADNAVTAGDQSCTNPF